MTTPSVPLPEGLNPSTSMSLLELARANDAEAWARIVDLYSPLVYGWCRRMGLGEADTLDVGQDVFVTVVGKLSQFRKEKPRDSFRRWLKTIVSNRVIDLYRAHRLRPQAPGGSDAVTAMANLPVSLDHDNEAADETEEKLLLRRAIEMIRGDFEPRTWTAFWRTAVDDVTAADVAMELGITTNAVHLAKSRVLRRLADQFAELVAVDRPA